jgi:hypothetical protein
MGTRPLAHLPQVTTDSPGATFLPSFCFLKEATMFKKFVLAAAAAYPGFLPVTDAKADAPTSALQTTVQTVEKRR